jgi:hypothetical protein
MGIIITVSYAVLLSHSMSRIRIDVAAITASIEVSGIPSYIG